MAEASAANIAGFAYGQVYRARAAWVSPCYSRRLIPLSSMAAMDLQLEDRTALVTGASMGIGRAIAVALAAEGVKLAVVARRRALLEDLAREIEAAQNPPVAIIIEDIMAPDAPQRIAAAALAALGKVDILVNCAGGSRPLPVDAPEERWEEAMTLNFTRLRQLTHAILPGMIERGHGRIINITGKSEPDRLNAAFAAKAAVHAWAKGLSRDIGRHGITVNSIAPGRIMSEQIRRNYPEEERKRFSAAEIPLGAYGEPEDLANLAVFLASPRARYITGTVIPVDGGLRRYSF
jgi:3-oxoacyl-[acyl-carrier protein] reductase